MTSVSYGDLFIAQQNGAFYKVPAEDLWTARQFMWFPDTSGTDPGFTPGGIGLPVKMKIGKDARMEISAGAGTPAMTSGEVWFVVLRIAGLKDPLRFETTESNGGASRVAVTRLPPNTMPGVEVVIYEIHKEGEPLIVGRPNLKYDAVTP